MSSLSFNQPRLDTIDDEVFKENLMNDRPVQDVRGTQDMFQLSSQGFLLVFQASIDGS